MFHTSPPPDRLVWYDIPDQELGQDSVTFQSTGFMRNETQFQMGVTYKMFLRVWNIITCPHGVPCTDYVHSDYFLANTSDLGWYEDFIYICVLMCSYGTDGVP